MSGRLIVHHVGPQVTVQDMGRAGYLAQGVSVGGAADRVALIEAEALLGHPGAALEMAGMGGTFEVTAPQRVALTGAPMQATCDGVPLAWHAVHRLEPGQRLQIGGATSGVYGYLSFGGGIDTPEVLGAQAAHLLAGLGARLQSGDELPLGVDPGGRTGMALRVAPRWQGGTLRFVDGPQTPHFAGMLDRFAETRFTRDARANRQGVRISPPGDGFAAPGGLSLISEAICPGDIQIAGDGAPFVLLWECQTMGGYPRIGTVIAPDMPLVVQAPPGAPLQFLRVSRDEARAALTPHAEAVAQLQATLHPLLRDPSDMRDLLRYNMISGVTAGAPEEEEHWP